MMNKKKIAVLLGILAGTILTFTAVVSTSAYTDSDPLITLSYLEQVFKPSVKQEVVDEVSESISAFASASTENLTSIDTAAPAASPSYTLVELAMGQTLSADSICEFIVRPGSRVVAVSPFPAQGIADITNGVEVLNGEPISINAYCLIPRGGDGRGLTVIGERAYIMIRGDYTIG